MDNIVTEDALKRVLDGSAILITGSGASWGAKNTSNEDFPSGYKLATALYKKCDLPKGEDLRDASDTYLEKFSKTDLIADIKRFLRVKSVESWHDVIFSKPWRTIYTTNYDEIPIVSASNTECLMTAITLDMDFRTHISAKNKCIFINGYIGMLNEDTLDNQFKLNSNSYLSSQNICNSQWGALLNEDIESAKAIIIIGLSLEYDLDLERILAASNNTKNKTLIITSSFTNDNDENLKKVRKLSRFGKVYTIGIEGFADALEKVSKDYSPPIFTPETYPFSCFEYRHKKAIITQEPTSDDVFSYYIYGNFSENLVFARDGKLSAMIDRSVVNEIFNYILKNKKIVFLHSYFGNGKTGIVELLKRKVSNENIHIFELKNTYYSVINNEIDIISLIEGKKIVIIEDFPKVISVLKNFSICSIENITFILTARTGLIEAVSPEVESMFNIKNDEGFIFDVNSLSHSELIDCNTIFERYGYWGVHSRKSHTEKIKILKNKNYGNSALQSILLIALKSEDIAKKLLTIINEIRHHSDDYFEVLMLALTSRVMKLGLSVRDINIVLNLNTMRDIKFKSNKAVQELISLDDNEMGFRVNSSVVANKILGDTANSATIVGILYKLANYASLYSLNQKYYNILRDIISFSLISTFIEKFEDKSTFILSYYENLSGIQYYTKNHFFWLQYAMACMEIHKYERAQKYLDTAYGLSAIDEGFVPFQINNQQAKLLLTLIEQGKSKDIESDFLKAHSLLIWPIVSKKDNPAVVMNLFRFYVRDSFKEKFMSNNLKSIFLDACADGYNTITILCKNIPQEKKNQYESLLKNLMKSRFSS